MPRLHPDQSRRTVTMETKRRSVDLPLDGAGHIRRAGATDFRLLRGVGDDNQVTGFTGKFIPFGQRQWIGSKRYGWWEMNSAGCITKTISEKRGENNDITFNRDHDNRLLLARTSNGTLRLTEDAAYGHADADMGAYSYTGDIVTALDRRDLTGMSYAFDVIGYEWAIADDGNDLLILHEIELFDVAVVGMPANVDTSAGLRMDLLAVARSAGFDVASFDTLARRLADPDDALIAALRELSTDGHGEQPPAPAETTQGSTDLDARSGPPAETTDAPQANQRALATLATRMSLQEEQIR